MSNTQEAVEAARIASDVSMGKVGLGLTGAGGPTLFFGGYTLNDVAMILGGVATILGIVLHMYSTYDTRRINREKSQLEREKARMDAEWHRARMQAWKNDSIGASMEEAMAWEEEAKRQFVESHRE